MKQATLCLVLDSTREKVLLGMKKPGLFGAGNYNGPGGKCKENETLEQAAARELKEESSLIASIDQSHKVGEFDFYFPGEQEKWNQTVHVYLVHQWQGTPTDSDEMVWSWFNFNQVPYDKMWDGDKHWMPLVLAGKRLKGSFYFTEDRKVGKKELNEVNNF